MPLRPEERFWKPTQQAIEAYLWSVVYQPIIDLMNEYQSPVVNSQDAIKQALRRGTISYESGEFSGRFTAKISKELRRFSDFDRRSKTWKVRDLASMPPDIYAAAVAARDRAIKLTSEIEKHVNGLEAKIKDTVATLSLPIAEQMKEMDAELQKDIAVKPDITAHMQKKLVKDYTENQHLNIKDWAPEEVERLRKIVEKTAKSGYRRGELREFIKSEWEVTANKAKFLARQETSLFLSKLRRERFLEAGITKYRWSAIKDARLRDRHEHLHGQVFSFGEPPITDDKGNRNEPGEDYNCRCVAIPIQD